MRYLTASNVAAVIGANPYCSVKQVFRKYVLKQDGSSNYFTRKGIEWSRLLHRNLWSMSVCP
jgi:hypothetical protein